MKYAHLLLFVFLPFASLMAQNYDPEGYDPDTLEVEMNEQEIKDLNSGKAVVEESTVMDVVCAQLRPSMASFIRLSKSAPGIR